jgi:hypothetical protein
MDTEMAGTRGDASGERAAKTQVNLREAGSLAPSKVRPYLRNE